ncbi:alpha/beta-hydrolase [Mycena leptocephala]|nr:alpha/beta-hydrolase [Mycena leptocephala]
MSQFAFHRQPLKTVYLAYFLTTTLFVRLPCWALVAAIPALRRRKSWPFRRALMLHVMKALVGLFFDIGFPVAIGQHPEEIASSPTANETGFTWVEPVAKEQIVGELKDLAALNNVKAARTSGYWYTSPTNIGTIESASPDEKVIMHLHSGGHVMGSAHPDGGPAGPFCTDLLRHCSQVKRIFSCGYRLASSTPFPVANPFPAAVLDSIAGYNYLVHTVGFQPQHIFICGDSAGGNLAIALIRYLAQNTFSVLSLPVPGGLILASPTVEWGITHNATNSSWRLNRGSDFSGPFFRGYTLRSLLGNLPVDFAFKSTWISPASLSLSPYDENLFKGFPATFILAGGAEIALDSIETFRDRLSQNIGEDNVTYIAMKDVTHDVVTMRWFEPERTYAIMEIATWIGQVLD